MAEYIDRDTVIKKIRRMPRTINPDLVQYSLVKGIISNIEQADAVPVVRCRECRHYRETRTKRYGNLICRCTRMGKHDMDYPVKPDDFCSYGERSTD